MYPLKSSTTMARRIPRAALALALAGLVVLVAACAPTLIGSQSGNPERPQPTAAPPRGETGGGAGGGEPGAPPAPIERVIIRTGQITLVVQDTRAARKAVEQMVAEMGAGGFVVSSNERGGTQERSPYVAMVVRVPAARFDDAMNRLAGLAVEVRDRTETAQDVTDEYVDLQARLQALETARDRLRQIMENAQTTEDLLQAEQQLTQREAEIESIQGRMQFLSESARLSEITLNLEPYILNQPAIGGWRLPETAREAFDALVESVQFAVRAAIYIGIAWLPWLLLWGLIIYGAIRVARRRRGRRSAPAPEAAPPAPPSPS